MFQSFKREIRVKALLNSSRVDRAKNNFQPCHINSLSVVRLVDARDLFLSILNAIFLSCPS